MDPNAYRTIESFIKSLEKVNQIIQTRNPTCIVAPMFGAVPFIDVLNIIDPTFPNNKVEYIPASNKVYRLREVLRGTFESLIDAHVPNGGSFLSLDEVVSGNSLVRVFKQFDAARTNHSNKKTVQTYMGEADFTKEHVRAFRDSITHGITYNSIGVVDSKLRRQKKEMSGEYEELVSKGIVIPVNTECIVTMDRRGYFPARYKEVQNDEGAILYLPVVDEFSVSSEYIDFLKRVSEVLGKNTNEVTVSNMGKIRDCYKWVPAPLRTL